MHIDEAKQIVSYLNAGFPRETLEPESAMLLANEIAALKNAEAGRMAARAIVRNGSRFPSVKEFRITYRSCRDSLARPQELVQEVGMPDWVKVWGWARANGDDRSLPQQVGYTTGGMMSYDEYEKLHAEWVAAGSPTRHALSKLAAGA